MKNRFVRRSLMYVPGSSPKMIAKAIDSAVDSIILDLEDSVSITEKENARHNVVHAIKQIQDRGKEAIVRVNSMNSVYGIHDVLALSLVDPDTLIIPKADEKALITAEMILEASEEKRGLEKNIIKLIPLIETTIGVVNIFQILNSVKRINGVQLGAEDLTKEQGVERTRNSEEIRYARDVLVYSGRACGVDIIDTPFTDIKDLDGLRNDTRLVKSIGFTGKTCIHPDHIETINDVFSPKEEEVQYAKRLLEAFEAGINEGKGACMFEGKMIDTPIADRAKKIIDKHNLINRIV